VLSPSASSESRTSQQDGAATASRPGTGAVTVVSASILAITEDPIVKDLLLEMALADGFGVRCAASEAEAAKLLHRERPGLLLVDLDMAGRAGLKFLRTLRQSLFRDIACVAVTASNDPMLSVAVDAPVFYKPDLDGLDAAVGRLFAHR
jgi:CheY-like chemotaxis protein